MSKYGFNVSLKPIEAIRMITQGQNAELLHKEIIQLDDGKIIGILVFEKYFFRAENRAGLTVIVSNVEGVTSIKSIASGSSKGMFFGFDWGAGDSFANSVNRILEDYIIK